MSARKPVPIVRGKRLDKRTRLRLLRKTRALLARPGVWVRGSYRKFDYDADRNLVEQYCLVGAVNHVAMDEGFKDYGNAAHDIVDTISLQELAESKGFRTVEAFNDASNRSKKRRKIGRDLDGVLAFLDEKIAMEEQS